MQTITLKPLTSISVEIKVIPITSDIIRNSFQEIIITSSTTNSMLNLKSFSFTLCSVNIGSQSLFVVKVSLFADFPALFAMMSSCIMAEHKWSRLWQVEHWELIFIGQIE